MKTFCDYYNLGTCRSCEILPLSYGEQVKFKEKSLLDEISIIDHPELFPTVQSTVTNFRNKVKFTVTGTLEAPIIGLPGEKALDQGREILECPLHLQKINLILPELKQFIIQAKIAPYQIVKKSGELKGVIIFFSEKTSEMYLRFICRSKEPLSRIQKFLPALLSKIPELKVVTINIQPIPHAILEGSEEFILTPNQEITFELGELQLQLSPQSFTQTNHKIAEKLYATAANWVKDSQIERFLELFCGQGVFSFFCASYIKEGLGIEINSSAINQATKTAQKLGLKHLHFKCADAQNVLKEVETFDPSLILVNPPRRGLAESINILLEQRPSLIIYSSCSHLSLAKDLKKLSPFYQISKIQIFDMFPNSTHFETLVELKLR